MNIKNEYDVLIIGGGIIGSTINYELSKYNLSIVQFEKNNYFGDETTTGNSGLIHGGFDAENPIEAKMNVEGNILWRTKILQDIKIPFVKIPSLILALNKEESKGIQELYERGIKNKLDPKDIRILNQKEIKEIEPNISSKVINGLLCTSSVAVDPVMATRAFIGIAKQNGSEAYNSSKVVKIIKEENHFIVEVISSGKKIIVVAKNIINAAGHYADIIGQMAKQSDFKLEAKRGEYRILAKSEASKINNVLFKIPTINGKGVIVAPMLDGRVLVGPTAEDGILKEDTRLITRNKYKFIGEIGHDIIPSLDLSRTEKVFSGSRPIYKKTNDFLIEYGKSHNFINVAGMQSPALSSAPAIAIEVSKLLKGNGTKLVRKLNFKNKFEMIW